ncbi:GTPase [Aliiruegeria lutimaris]|uniref:50S ribosome-binding GTPase n=1 Tax=Aliiruegeria lutimaris TaxID=571298 RepID=A0A1G8VFI7_9RHOB|nr:GTPase [Aliiruegeria lutimaris]SDJ64677.1 50S ribosome-binding GTPase [Aliiruegeria lutimaris]
MTRQSQKPVIALMGEFSAGKSTLANLILEEERSPVRVTATQMPPIWYTYGDGDPIRVDVSGTPMPLSEQDLPDVTVEDTAYVLIRSQAEVLQLMDVIDMPGISDPNLSQESWQRTIEFADAVIWCSHATQAWRQSEAATWSSLPETLTANGLLLLTRFDKLLTEQDRQRVLARVRAETDGQFRGIFPISLLAAAQAGDDRDAWEESGAEQFLQTLLEMVFEITTGGETEESPIAELRKSREAGATVVVEPVDEPKLQFGAHPTVVPKRVKANRDSQRSATERLPGSVMQERFI